MDPPSQESLPSLSKDDAQQALIKYASVKRCYSTKPAQEGVITSMEAFSTYRYHLKTFTETRCTKWSQRPYFGKAHFCKYVSEGCIRCNAQGRINCMSCGGIGRVNCWSCAGLGYTSYNLQNRQLCFICAGRGRRNCLHCYGSGLTKCDVCLGQRKVVLYINLIVEWLNDIDEHTVEQSSGLKMLKLCKVPGQVLFRDSNHMVYPVTNFPDPTVVQISERLLRKHQDKNLQTSRILQQCQTIELLPITRVTYEWKGESHVFFVYGRDFKVSAEDYPAVCCGCCCTVM